MVEYSSPPPPDILEPPASPFRRAGSAAARRARSPPCPAASGVGAAAGDHGGDDWDVDAALADELGHSGETDTEVEEPPLGMDEDGEGGSSTNSNPNTHRHGQQSMYVRLLDEMITTVLDGEEYLFTPREAWVLRAVLALPYEPHYLLTRLLLRRAGKVFPLAALVDAYSAEISAEGVKRAARVLAYELDPPASVLAAEAAEPQRDAEHAPGRPEGGSSEAIPVPEPFIETPQPSAAPPPPSVATLPPAGAGAGASTRPWSQLPTGLSKEEEHADPALAEVLRRSAWAEKHGVDPDEYLRACEESAGRMPHKAGPSRPAAVEDSQAPTGSGVSVTGDSTAASPAIDTNFSLAPRPASPICKLAHDETELGLDDIMTCVPVDELRRVARSRKIPPSLLATRDTTMAALRDVARRQTTLDFGGGGAYRCKGKGKARESAGRSVSTNTSEHLVIAQLLPLLGDHVLQVDRELYRLMARVNLVFSRTPPASTAQPALLLPPILVTAKKRHYPDCGPPQRSRIWATRDEMLVWERAVGWEVLVSEALGDVWGQVRAGGAPSVFAPRGQPLPRTECAKVVRSVWEEVWPVWKAMVAVDVPPPSGVVGDRFRTEHVLTRVVVKGAEALGVLHEYDLECEVLRALLGQRRWRRGKRGAWYERLALVLMTHYRGIPTVEERTFKLEDATQTCIDGLLDEDTHLIYRPALSRRLTRLESKLNLPPDERHISFAQLLTCETRELVALRSGQNIGVPKRLEREREDSGDDDAPQVLQQVGKSAWVGRDGEVTVEGWVLEWWQDRGYRGYHAESSILTTLFALLMWPVLFHPLPGAFETAYQTAPLDLGEDGFSRARRALIDARLTEMEDTDGALAMLREADARERPRGTWAVGLSWDFGADELAEIAECMGGSALAAICRMLSEEYRHRASGVPDLIVWKYQDREVRFVEVKGPGDSLSETQKIWIDVLLSAGVPVEVCRVKDKDEEDRRARELRDKDGRKRAGGAGGERSNNTSAARGRRGGAKGSGQTDPRRGTGDNTSTGDGGSASKPSRPVRKAAATALRPAAGKKRSAASVATTASSRDRDMGGMSRDEAIVIDDTSSESEEESEPEPEPEAPDDGEWTPEKRSRKV